MTTPSSPTTSSSTGARSGTSSTTRPGDRSALPTRDRRTHDRRAGDRHADGTPRLVGRTPRGDPHRPGRPRPPGPETLNVAGASSGRGIGADVHVEGLKETLRAFNTYGKEANRELRQAAGEEADRLVAAITLAAGTAGPQAALVATSVRRKSDRVPSIVAGGTRR